ncbi:MAG: UPF0175 family protein [Okeania sp. SIO3C4]|nr:UPF0175 family protein [Okeania sp. SIO3C4]
MTKVNDDITTILLDDDTRIEIAVLLFTLEKFTLGQASLFIGIDQIAMQHILKERDVPLHYGDDEFEQGLKGLELL